MRVIAACALAACVLLAFANPSATAQDAPQALRSADATLKSLLDEDYEAQLKASPTWASRRGDRRYDRLMPDNSPQARAALLRGWRDRLARVSAIDRDAISPGARLDAALLERELTQRIDAQRFQPWQTPVTQIGGPQRWIPDLVNQLSFTTDKHLDDYLARLEQVAPYLDQTIADMREGVGAGNTPPRITIAGAADQALSQGLRAIARSPRDHVMFQPFAGRDGERAARAERIIVQQVAPAFEELGVFLRDEYAPACRDTIAATDRPDGPAYYNAQIARHTTLDLTADQVHQVGLSEVNRIRTEMFGVIARTDFGSSPTVDPDDLFDAFTDHLRNDPRFYFNDPEDLLNAYRAIGKRIDAELPRFFRNLPRLPWGVREMPPFIARSSPTAYYYPGSLDNGVAGYFVANTYKLDQRPKYEMIALTLHEAVPGHHLQNAVRLELEQQGLHRWRETVGYTAFGEGWALYSEHLGLEIEATPDNPKGLYADPYDDFGRLSYEMWRAMRLVVDTGIHAKGWSRGRAIAFMLANSALTPENVEREVDRYIAWPGQALGYKIGELKIRELRAKAEGELGDRFDLRDFHDLVIGAGSIPLAVLEERIDTWISTRSGSGQ